MPNFSNINQISTFGGEFNDIHGNNNRWTDNSHVTNLVNSLNTASYIATNSHNDSSKQYTGGDGTSSNNLQGINRWGEGADASSLPRRGGSAPPDTARRSSLNDPRNRAAYQSPHYSTSNPFSPLPHPFFPGDIITSDAGHSARHNQPNTPSRAPKA